MGLPVHHVVMYSMLFILEIVELSLLADAYSRFALYERSSNINLGVPLRAGILGSSLTVGISIFILIGGIMIRQWIHYLWHIILQFILFVYWLAVAIWLQVAFGKLSGRECRMIFGDSVCREGITIRVFAWLLMMFPLIVFPIIMYLEPEDSLALSRIHILGRRPVMHPEGRVLAQHGSTYGLTREDVFLTPVLADSMVEAGTSGMRSEIGSDSRRATLTVRMENDPAGGGGSGVQVDEERERGGGRERERRRSSMVGAGSKSGSGIRSGTHYSHRRARELPLAVQAEGRTRTRRTTE